MSDQAEAVVRMMRAHELHRPDRYRPSLIACAGATDPLTGHFCQFRGTPTEHYVPSGTNGVPLVSGLAGQPSVTAPSAK